MSPTRTAREDDAVHVLVQKGDRSFYVRQAKVATVRFLRAKRPTSTKALTAAIWKHRKDPAFGEDMARAIRLVQEIADLPPSGEITFSVDAELAAFWPRDSRKRRIMRATPAWRLIPGQLSPNFNVREFACHDGTGYVEGLVRERRMTPGLARARAVAMAQRLEKVRRLRGGKPVRVTSLYRTIPYNARIGGAKNSSHTRGFAADVPPAPGEKLTEHRADMRAAFECGIGFYPGSNFVHGDFDPTLGRREWDG